MNENELLALFWKIFGAVLALTVVSVSSCTAAVKLAIVNSPDPISSACAVENKATCLTVIARQNRAPTK